MLAEGLVHRGSTDVRASRVLSNHLHRTLLRTSLLWGLSACGPQELGPARPPPPPPAASVVATGDGDVVAVHLGPEGARLQLAANGPSLVVPKDTAPAAGLSLSMLREPTAVAPGARALGSAFRVSRTLLPPSGSWLLVISTPLAEGEQSCAPEALRLALQGPAQVGPSDGPLTWHFEPAKRVGDVAESQLVKLEPRTMQFVCTAP